MCARPESPRSSSQPFHSNDGEERAPRLRGTEALQAKIDALLKQVEHESEHFTQKISVLLEEVGTLRSEVKGGDARDRLLLRLRTANQNLVLATFGAQDLQAKAEAANHRQEEFLSMLAHELRNPLVPIIMATESLGTIAPAHPQLPKLHQILVRQTTHLTRLVDDLLDASRVNSGKIALQKRTLALSEIIESAVETAQALIEKQGQSLAIKLPSEPVAVHGDLVRLAQVFSNLLINAAKFTPDGGHITVSANALPDMVTISVLDDGIGIAPAVQAQIFDMFEQGPCSLDRTNGGLGIGLSLVQTILQMHGGTVEVRSDGLGSGSEFRVRLPVDRERKNF